MRYNFPEKFHALLCSLPLDFDPFGEIDDNQEVALIDAVSDHLAFYGVNETGDGESEMGTLCADFLTWLAQNEQ